MNTALLDNLYTSAMGVLRQWRNLVIEALKEVNKPLYLEYDEEEEKGFEVYATTDNYVRTYYATMVRYNKDNKNVQLFIVSDHDGKEINEWCDIFIFDPECKNDILSSIQWNKK